METRYSGEKRDRIKTEFNELPMVFSDEGCLARDIDVFFFVGEINGQKFRMPIPVHTLVENALLGLSKEDRFEPKDGKVLEFVSLRDALNPKAVERLKNYIEESERESNTP